MEHGYAECVSGFEASKRLTPNGVEYWMATELMPLLAYASWDKFKGVVERARTAAGSASIPVDNHFSRTGSMVAIGSGAEREKQDWFLSRYACHLIAMNADSAKPEVSHAMTYFAIQTRRQELQDQLTEAEKRVQLRMRVMDSNHHLAGAAKTAGVVRYPIFQDAGHRGLYGMGIAAVKTHKGLKPSQDLLDNVGRLELSAHEFRANMTEERLKRDEVKTEGRAIETHRAVGREVREVMLRDKGVRPEDLKTEPSITRLVRKQRRLIKDAKAR